MMETRHTIPTTTPTVIDHSLGLRSDPTDGSGVVCKNSVEDLGVVGKETLDITT